MTEPVPPENKPLHPGGDGWLDKLARSSLPALLALLAWPAVRGYLEGWAEREEGGGIERLLLFAVLALAPWLLKWRTERAAKPTTRPDQAKPLEPS